MWNHLTTEQEKANNWTLNSKDWVEMLQNIDYAMPLDDFRKPRIKKPIGEYLKKFFGYHATQHLLTF